jgi:hypothetical protein
MSRCVPEETREFEIENAADSFSLSTIALDGEQATEKTPNEWRFRAEHFGDNEADNLVHDTALRNRHFTLRNTAHLTLTGFYPYENYFYMLTRKFTRNPWEIRVRKTNGKVLECAVTRPDRLRKLENRKQLDAL